MYSQASTKNIATSQVRLTHNTIEPPSKSIKQFTCEVRPLLRLKHDNFISVHSRCIIADQEGDERCLVLCRRNPR